jgi:nucleoside-diphosphate-sugar epimerase
MIRMIARGRFPPLPDSANRRSMVDVRDVVEAMLLCAKTPVAAGQIYIVTDDQMYSTRQIYEWICQALSRSVPRWTVPWTLWRLFARTGDVAGRLLGRRVLFDSQSLSRLTGSAWYSSERIMRELNYRPRHQLKSSLLEMIRDAGIQR